MRQDSAGTSLKYSYYAKDGRLLWQRDEPASKRINNVYLAGSLLAEITRPIGNTTATISYFHTDALGSPIAKTNAAGAIIETSEYEPYGRLLNRANDNRAGYTGHVMDAASGLTYMQQRYYDPGIGRFLSVDPVTADAKSGDNFNRYWYARNNPYTLTDPDGRWSPKAHDELLQHAFTGRLTAQDVKTLQQSSRDFDKQTQSPNESHKHSMAQEGQSGADAIKQRDSFIGKTMVAARGAADQGDRQGALKLLGQALHPVMDSSSPEHTNSDGTPKEWKGAVGSTLDGQRHSPTDFIGNETSSDITSAIYKSQDQRLNNAYDWVFREQHDKTK
nr:RHS repeat-associated core domain-containing protein [Thermomonas beijingensis]